MKVQESIEEYINKKDMLQGEQMMKKNNKKTAKKLLAAILTAMLAISMLTGCGKSGSLEADESAGNADSVGEVVTEQIGEETEQTTEEAQTENEEQATAETQEAETEYVGDMELGDEPSNDFEIRVGKTSFSSLDEIIGLLEGDEAYALVDVKGKDDQVLLVSSFVYDDLEGHIATTECTPYTLHADGLYHADSVIYSGGSATPVAIDSEGYIYAASSRSVEKNCYGDNGTDTTALMLVASVYIDEMDDNGNPITVGGFVRESNDLINCEAQFLEGTEVDTYKQLFAEFEKAEPINFTKATN